MDLPRLAVRFLVAADGYMVTRLVNRDEMWQGKENGSSTLVAYAKGGMK